MKQKQKDTKKDTNQQRSASIAAQPAQRVAAVFDYGDWAARLGVLAPA